MKVVGEKGRERVQSVESIESFFVSSSVVIERHENKAKERIQKEIERKKKVY